MGRVKHCEDICRGKKTPGKSPKIKKAKGPTFPVAKSDRSGKTKPGCGSSKKRVSFNTKNGPVSFCAGTSKRGKKKCITLPSKEGETFNQHGLRLEKAGETVACRDKRLAREFKQGKKEGNAERKRITEIHRKGHADIMAMRKKARDEANEVKGTRKERFKRNWVQARLGGAIGHK